MSSRYDRRDNDRNGDSRHRSNSVHASSRRNNDSPRRSSNRDDSRRPPKSNYGANPPRKDYVARQVPNNVYNPRSNPLHYSNTGGQRYNSGTAPARTFKTGTNIHDEKYEIYHRNASMGSYGFSRENAFSQIQPQGKTFFYHKCSC